MVAKNQLEIKIVAVLIGSMDQREIEAFCATASEGRMKDLEGTHLEEAQIGLANHRWNKQTPL